MDIDYIVDTIVDRLKGVPGVEAIVLGGSRARGTNRAESDIDIGIYYTSDYPVDTSQLALAARALDDLHREDIITAIGEWGPWINGGGWLKVKGLPVDFLYRDIGKVDATIQACLEGKVTIDYQPGHPHGFVNSIYMGEVALCRILWDPQGLVTKLKVKSLEYPAALCKGIVSAFMWEAAFSVVNAEKAVSRRDIAYAAGHLYRAVSCMTHVLFALNERYLINEKGAVSCVSGLTIVPDGFERNVVRAFTVLSAEESGLEQAIDIAWMLVRQVQVLAGDG
jgi:predicted nucleotidyltransferase